MENLFYHISQVLGITILHSLWQGLLIYMVLRLVLQILIDKPAALKYQLSFAALGAMLLWFGYTLYAEVGNYAALHAAPLAPTGFMPLDPDQLAVVPIDRYYFVIAGYLPYITMLYIAGLVFNTLKMAFAWNNIYRIRKQVTPANFQDQVNGLAQSIGVARFVKVAFSEYIDVPCITGFIKPLILLPCAISTYLTAEEVKAILLHELAHIKRNDYLLNMVQQAIGILLFFNPFSKLIGNIISRERENCCDDVVVHTTGTPLVYAQALLKLEENKQQDWHLALAATGKKHHLLNRIERIMKTKKTTVNIRPVLVALVLLTCSLSSIAWLNPKMENGKVSVKSIPSPLVTSMFDDTIPTKKSKTATPAFKSKPATKKASAKAKNFDADMDDAKMQKLQAELEQHSMALDKYYNSPEFKKMQEDMEKKGAEMEAYYNNPKFKELQANMEKKSAEFEKMNNSPEMKKWQDDMEAVGKKIEAYYSGPEYAKIQKEYQKEAELYTRSKPGTAEYKQHEENFKKLALKFKDYANNPAIKEQTELAKKMGVKMRDYYNNPEFKKTQEEMRAYGDSMRKTFQGSAMKEQQDAMRQMGKQMREYQKRPEIIREREELKKVEKELRAYQKSPEYRKKRMAEIESTNDKVRDQVRKEIAEARQTAQREVKERREAPERAESPERKERRESPERARKTDTTTRLRERAPAKTRQPESASFRGQKTGSYSNVVMAALTATTRYNFDTIPRKAAKSKYKAKADVVIEAKKPALEEVVIDEPVKEVAIKAKKAKVYDVVIDEPVKEVAIKAKKAKVYDVVIDEPIKEVTIKAKKPKLYDVVIDEPVKEVTIKAKKPKLYDVVIDEPVKEVTIKAKKPKMDEVAIEAKKPKLKEVVIEEPQKQQKPGK